MEGQRLLSEVRAILDEGGADALAVATQGVGGIEKKGDKASEVLANVALSEAQLAKQGRPQALKTAMSALKLAQANMDKRGEAVAKLAVFRASGFQDTHSSQELVKSALEIFRQHEENSGTAEALLCMAQVEGNASSSVKLAKEASSIYQRISDKKMEQRASLAALRAELGHQATDMIMLPTLNVLQIFRSAGDKKGQRSALQMTAQTVALMHLAQDDPEATTKVAAEGLATKQTKDSSSYLTLLDQLADVSDKKSPAEATKAVLELLTGFQNIGDKRGEAGALCALATVLLDGADPAQAMKPASDALDIYKHINDRVGILNATALIIMVYGLKKPQEMMMMLQEAQDAAANFEACKDKQGHADALHLTAAMQYMSSTRRGESTVAKSAVCAAQTLYQELEDKDGEMALLMTATCANLKKGTFDEAMKLAQEVLAAYEGTGDKSKEAAALKLMANVLLARGHVKEALNTMYEAVAIAEELQDQLMLMALLTQIKNVMLLMRDVNGAINSVQATLAICQDVGDAHGEASNLMNMAQLVLRGEDPVEAEKDALRVARDALSVLTQIGDKALRVSVLHFMFGILHRRRMSVEAMIVAEEAVMIMRELGNKYGEAMAQMMVATSDIKSRKGLEAAVTAITLFKDLGNKNGQATALHAVANGILLTRGDPKEAIGAAQAGLGLHRDEGNRQGEAIMLQTLANCHLCMRDFETAVTSSVKALQIFKGVGDEYGEAKSLAILDEVQRAGGAKGDELVHEALRPLTGAPPIVELDEYEVKKSAATKLKEKQEEDESKKAMQPKAGAQGPGREDVNWEHAWLQVPIPTNDKKAAVKPRVRIFHVTEMSAMSLTKLRKGKASPQVNVGQDIVNKSGEILPMAELQRGIRASECTGVVYDTSKMHHVGPLVVMEGAIRLVQAVVGIEEINISIDTIGGSMSQGLAYVGTKREPFHAGLWGFYRAARLEHPTKDFRVLDVDVASKNKLMPLICRYTLGANSAKRPLEGMFRNKVLFSNKLIGGRVPLSQHHRIEIVEE